MLLRIAVGFHFYKEGTAKLKSGTFTSKYFLAAAKGPMAPLFQDALDDWDGAQRLCVTETMVDGQPSYEIDPSLTLQLWDDYLDRAYSYYGFGSPELQEKLAAQRAELADKIQRAREAKDSSVDTAALERQREELEQAILAIREQPKQLEAILEEHRDQLLDWLDANRVALISHFNTESRLDGFQRDGENREEAALYVASLRGQVDTIRSDRQKQLNGWTAEVTAMWDSLEQRVQGLAVASQAQREPIPVHRPFDQEYSFYKVVDKVIPWFDTIIGVSLILGLFARWSSLAASLFLMSVIATQPPWIPGTEPTYFYFIELLALLVIFATCAGRYGGLDFFLNPALYRRGSTSGQAAGRTISTSQIEGQPT